MTMNSTDNGAGSGMSRDPPQKRLKRVTCQLQYIQEKVLKAVWGHQDAWPFHIPVDAEALNIPEYRDMIKHPMDLGTIKKKLETNVYCSVAECIEDFNQMFTNVYLFNMPGSDITIMCQKLEKFFLEQMQQMPQNVMIFDGCKIAVEFSPSWKFKQKQAFCEKITQNGGTVAYAVSKQSSFLLLTDPEGQAGSYRSQTAQRYSVPVLVADFVNSCVENGKLLDYENFLAAGSTKKDAFSAGRIMTTKPRVTNNAQKSQKDVDIDKLQVWTWRDASAPEFDEEGYQMAKGVTLFLEQTGHTPQQDTLVSSAKKYSAKAATIQTKTTTFPAVSHRRFMVIEIHVSPEKESNYPYRIFLHYGTIPQRKSDDSDFGTKDCRYLETAEEALSVYAQLYDRYTSPMHGYSRSGGMLHPCIGSSKYREYIRNTEWSTVTPHPEVTRVVELFWAEAVGELDEQLSVSPENITLDQVESAEAVLMDIRDVIRGDYNNDSQVEADEDAPAFIEQKLQVLSEEFYKYLPHEHPCLIHLMKYVAQKQDLCQLLRDMRDIRESIIPNMMKRGAAKLFYLHCSIDYVEVEDPDYSAIKQLAERFNTDKEGVQVQGVYRVRRSVENERFTHDLSNRQLLLHASRPQNFVGILSRGLLMPKIVVDDYGGTRSDPGMLGDGLYFSDSAMTCAKYSRPSTESGSRFLLVHEVALGNCLSTYTHNTKCQGPPADYHSLHGVQASQGTASDFMDDEYVIYNTAQQRMRYMVEFSCTTDKCTKQQEHLNVTGTSNIKPFGQINSHMTKNVQQQHARNSHPADKLFCSDLRYMPVEELKQKIDMSDVENVKDPLSNVQLGLVAGNQAKIVLKEVHVRAKMVDLVAKVVLLQSYTNAGQQAVEGKYVFAVDDLAIVSGFEAFINGKHVVGKVKEKEEARTEYKQAIKEGHGAYLMEQQGETPEVSTVSVGNLPPGASVLIKITYITELTVDADDIIFSLPSSLATWKHNEVLNTQTQVGLDMAQVSKPREISLQVAIEMPFYIKSIKSPSHKIKIKQTETKALVALRKNESLDKQFTLQVALASVHSPRMWVERHPESDDSRACMLAFYPEFDTANQSSSELVLLLDMSNSMSPEDVHAARKVLLLSLAHCPQSWTFNAIIFGTGFVELFPRCQQNTKQNRKLAFNFLQNQHLHCGNTEVYGALKPHYLLPPPDGTTRNIFLLSDGDIKNEEMVLQAVFDNQSHTRMFTMGIGNSCNKHCMRKLAQNGAGAFEHFDPARKSRWVHSIKEQLQRATQPVLTSVDVDWEQFEDERKPLQAPQHISSLFNGSRLVVYGFVPNCTQATLKARIGGKEVSTLVSTSELCISTGTMLHQLTTRSVIRDWEDGMLNKDKTLNAVLKRKRKNYIINMSKKFSIVSQFTSFVAVEKRSGDEINNSGPSLADLVTQEDVDPLMYMGWEDAVSEDHSTASEKVRFDETEVCKAKEEFNALVSELDCLSEDTYKERSVRIMELRDIIEAGTHFSNGRKAQEEEKDDGEPCVPGFEEEDEEEKGFIMPFVCDKGLESNRSLSASLENRNKCVIPVDHNTGQLSSALDKHSVAQTQGTAESAESNEKSSPSGGLFRLPNQNTTLSGGGAGMLRLPNQATASSGGGGLFGSSDQTTASSGRGGLFGSSNQTTASSGGGGLFGSSNQTTASSGGRGLFGSSNQTTASSGGGGLFGSSNQATASSGGGGLFGTSNQTTASPGGGGLFGSFDQTTASSGGGGLFGSSNQTTTSSGGGGLFGSSNQATASSGGGGLFGSSNQTTASPGGGGLFGSSNQTTASPGGGGLFGSFDQTTASSGGGGLFGSSNQTTTSSGGGGLFGSSNQTTTSSGGGGLFGSSNQTTASPGGGGLFGSSNQTTASPGGGGLFGSSNQTTASPGGGGLFGSSNQTTASPGGRGLFGSSNQTIASPGGGGLFGSSNQTTASPGGGGLFGSSNQTTASSGGLFGSSNQSAASSEGGGLFGSSNQTTASSGRGGLFGSSSQATPSLSGGSFGSSQQGFSFGSQTTYQGTPLCSQTTQPVFSFGSQTTQQGSSLVSQTTQQGFSFGSQTTQQGSLLGSQTTQQGSPFGSQTTQQGSLLGSQTIQPVSSFGSQTTQPVSSFGSQTAQSVSPSASQTTEPVSPFGSQTTQPVSSFGSHTAQQGSLFGSQPTQPVSAFGSQTTQQGSSFGSQITQQGSSLGSQPTQPSSSFGCQSTQQGSSFGSQPTQQDSSFGSQLTQRVSSFGTQPSTFRFSSQPTQSAFGFGSQPTQPASTFGSQSIQQGASFGTQPIQPASAFGSPMTQTGSFGSHPTQPVSTFGSQTMQQGFSFGTQPIQPASAFGSQTTQQGSSFGSHPTPPVSTFGSQTTQQGTSLGTKPIQPTSAFGSQTTQQGSSFGSHPTQPVSTFGSQTTQQGSSFGTQPIQPASAFGSQVARPGPSFGSQSTQSAFRFGSQPTQPAFGCVPQPQQPVPVFGSWPTQPVSLFGSQPTPADFGFSSQPTQPVPLFRSQLAQSAFGFGSQHTRTVFGSGSQPAQPASLFGSQATQPVASFGSQPTRPVSFGTQPAQSAFGFGYFHKPACGFGSQPTQPSSSFDSQPTQPVTAFGTQPTQSANGFGSQPTQPVSSFGSQPAQAAFGYGSQSTQSAFGLDSQHSQSSFSSEDKVAFPSPYTKESSSFVMGNSQVSEPPVWANGFLNLFEKLKICEDLDAFKKARMMADDNAWLSFEEQRTLYYYLCLITEEKFRLMKIPKTDSQSIGVQTSSSSTVDISGSGTLNSSVCSSKRKFEDEVLAEDNSEDQVKKPLPVKSAGVLFVETNQKTAPFGGVVGSPYHATDLANKDEIPTENNREEQDLHQVKKPLPVKAKSNPQDDIALGRFATFGVDLDTLNHLQPGVWWTLGPELTKLLGSVVERCHRELRAAGLNSLGESTAKDLEHLVGSLLVLGLLIRHSPVCKVSQDGVQGRPLAEVIHDVFSDVTSTECAIKPYWLEWKTGQIQKLFPDTGDGEPWYHLADQMGDMLLGHVTSQRLMGVVGPQFTSHAARLARAAGYCRGSMKKHKSICSMLELEKNWLDFVLKFI